MSDTATKALRDGNAEKRAAILAAARERFVRDGVERVSMDAVAAEAKVSKRTIYDYFGDKRRLLLEVVLAASHSLVASIDAADAEFLADDARLLTVDELERALDDFAVAIATTVFASADYLTVRLLLTQSTELRAALEALPLSEAPEQVLAARIAHLAQRGLLDVDDPDLASEHFKALTMLLALESYWDGSGLDLPRVRSVMLAGVHAFIRAYGARGR